MKKPTPKKRPTPKARMEVDSLGRIGVPAEHYWGAQTERSRQNFRISGEFSSSA